MSVEFAFADKYIVSENFRNYNEMVDMSSMQLPSFEETAFQSKMARMRRIGFIGGEKKGFNEGKKKGFNEGKKKGFNEGKKKGFNEGKKKGFDDGVKEGHADVVKNLLKHYDAFKVSEIAGLDLDFVWDVENNNY